MSTQVLRSDKKQQPERGEDERSLADQRNGYPQRSNRSRERDRRCACEDARMEGTAETGGPTRNLTCREDDTAGTTRNLVRPSQRVPPRSSAHHSGEFEDISKCIKSEYRYKGEGYERENSCHSDRGSSQTSFGEIVQQHRHRPKEGHHETTAIQVATGENVDKLKEKNSRLKDRVKTCQVEVKRLSDKLQESERENNHLRRQLEAKERHHAADRQLLEQRMRELQCAQTYLTPVRSYSGRELIDLVEELNTEVLHASASITDAVDFTYRNDKDSLIDGQDFLVKTKMIVGNEVVNVLLGSNHCSDAFRTVVQSALQTAILRHLAQMLNSWCADVNRSRIFAESYESIRKHVERPSIAGRWKALTKAQSKYASYAAMEQFIGNEIYDSIISILYVAGKWSKKEFDRQIDRQRRGIIDSHIRELLNRAGQLDRILGEIIDEEWEVYYIHPGQQYNQCSMVDTYAAAPNKAKQRAQSGSSLQTATIFCTTELGMWKKTENRAMLKAKVLLQTTVMEGLDESSTGNTQSR